MTVSALMKVLVFIGDMKRYLSLLYTLTYTFYIML